MIKLTTLATAACLLSLLPAHAQDFPVIPKPVKAEKKQGSYTLNEQTAIRYLTPLKKEAELLASAIGKATGVTPKLYDSKLKIKLPNPINLSLGSKKGEKEGYTLEVNNDFVNIMGNDHAGAFYGCQTLLQLIPQDGSKDIAACQISDNPRFGWRGMHLDVARHMFDVKDIKKFIDWLAVHKMNTLHWHLTEDQGWRIEIKKYPKLTEVGAWRESTPPYGNRIGSDGKRYGGFYTQKQIKDIVAYAKERHVTIVPEIDMPGHMAAAIAAYPHLGNDDVPNYNPKVANKWGVFHYTLSPKESTFKWIDDVLTEVCEMFPSTYIHIGGDEAPKNQWHDSKFAQSVIKREKLKDEHELQSYFIGRVDKILEKKGRKLIGWDEIREGGLSPNATMMLWRGWNHAIASVNEGHDVVMAPTSHTYFDYYQHTPALELAKGAEFEHIGGHLNIQKVYSFNPMPKEFRGTPKAKHILGCQAQLWSEYMHKWDRVEYSAFPRLAAIAETGWTPQESRKFDDFMLRLKPMLKRYKAGGVRHFNPFNPSEISTKDDAEVQSNISVHGGHVAEFAYDGKASTKFWSNRAPKLGDHLTVSLKKSVSGTVSAITGGEGKQAGDILKRGVLEATTNGKKWIKVAEFKNGTAKGKLPANTTGIRIRPTGNQENWLIVSEISVK